MNAFFIEFFKYNNIIITNRMFLKYLAAATLFFSIVITAAGQGGGPPVEYYTSIDNYTGDWEDPGSWEGGESPGLDVDKAIINIYGAITANSSLEIDSELLVVNDTLIIHGDLILGNNADLSLNEGAVLIIYGNLSIANRVDIAANGTLVVTGDMTKTGATNQGSFNSESDPPQVYIGGSVPDMDDSNILECDTEGHENTGCNYGDMEDAEDSPVNDFIQDNCPSDPEITLISSNSPVSTGESIELSGEAEDPEGGDLTYRWKGPEGFLHYGAEAETDPATEEMTGYYIFSATNDYGCRTSDSLEVMVIAGPVAEITALLSGSPVCEGEYVVIEITLSGTPPFTFSLEDNHSNTWKDITIQEAYLEGGSPYTYEFVVPDPPEWVNNGIMTQYIYSVISVSDANGEGIVEGEGAEAEIYRLPVSGPNFHISNSE